MSSPTNVRLVRPALLCLEDRTTPSAGALDPSFGIGGLATARGAFPSNDTGRSTVIDRLGRIVIVGDTDNGSNTDFTIVRLTPAGVRDSAFNGNGVITFAMGNANDIATAVAIDSLNRVVVAGYISDGSNNHFAVARLTAEGILDTTFDGDGKKIITFGSSDSASSIAVDSMDRIVVAGNTSNGSNLDFAIARLTAAGALDASFDADGKQTIAFGAANDLAYGVTVDHLDRVVVTGIASNGSNYDFAVARLTASGALDPSFDADGKQTISFGARDDWANAVALDSQGRIVLAGYANNGSNDDFALARLTSAGALDATFDGDGKQTLSFDTQSEEAASVAVDSLDRIIVGGTTTYVGITMFGVARLTASGGLDPSFHGDGKQVISFGPHSYGSGVAADSSDRVLIVGASDSGSTLDIAAARFTVAGAYDSSFDDDGKLTLDLKSRSQAVGRSVAIDHHGRYIEAGYSFNGTHNDFMVARYASTGALDPTFGPGGIVNVSFGDAGDTVSVAVDSLDRVIVTSPGNHFAVIRLTATGQLDTTFDGDGKQTITFSTSSDVPRGIAVDSLNRVIVVGEAFNGVNSQDFAVARLTEAGELDSTFDGDGKKTIAFGPSSQTDIALGVAIDSLGQIVVAGFTGNAPQEFAVARLTADGNLDSTFDNDGMETIDFGSTYETAYGVAIDSQNQIVLAGYTGFSHDFAIARLKYTGGLDGNFDGDGKLTVSFGAGDDEANSVAIDSQGRIVAAGFTDNGTNLDMAVARITAAGALDPSFDNDGKQTIAFGAADDIARAVVLGSADQPVVAGYSEFNGQVFALARLTGDTTTASAQVNDGSAQRSRVTSVTVRFSSQVAFSGSPDQAFTLVRTGGGSVSFTATVSLQNGGTVVTLDHFTGPDTEFGSLADGRYTLTALASQISANGQALDGDADGTAGGNFVFNDTQGLFRLFGDVNGDQTVNGFDLGFFRNAFGTQTGDANYLSYLDLNGDGVINGFDLGQFRTRFGTMLP
jgi:uncharacterized delta-60 repeat protein